MGFGVTPSSLNAVMLWACVVRRFEVHIEAVLPLDMVMPDDGL